MTEMSDVFYLPDNAGKILMKVPDGWHAYGLMRYFGAMALAHIKLAMLAAADARVRNKTGW